MDKYRESEIGLPPLVWPKAYATADEWLEVVHAEYRAIVQDARLRLFGMQVQGYGSACSDGRSTTFWHAITDGVPGHKARRLSILRGAMLGQVWHVLDLLAAGDVRVLWWREPCRKDWRLYVVPIDFRFVVVLNERGGSLKFVTAYPLSHRRRRSMSDRAAAAYQAGHCDLPDRRHPKWRREPARCPAVVARWEARGTTR